jgi:type IV pilus assembly protein PilC
MRFTYQARDSAGQSMAGVLTANDINEASKLLRRDGKIIVSLSPEADRVAKEAEVVGGGSGRIKRDDVIFFSTQLAVMVDTGVPLIDSLDCIVDGTKPGAMREVLKDVSEQVKGGMEFSAALGKHPKVFSKLFTSMLKASEASGTMGTMLQRISEYLEQDRDLRKKIKGAMTYPIFMLSFCMLVVTGLLLFVLPRFEKIYAGKGALLPLPTRILLGLSNGIINYWPFVLVVLVAAGFGVYMLIRTPGGRIKLDDIRLKLPVLGPMTQKACLARSLRTFATMVSTGVSMLESLSLTAEVAGNYFYSEMWNDVAAAVQEGSSLTDELQKTKLIPRPIVQMISAGEHTGQLSMVMNRAAAFCENDLKVAIKTVTDLIEPMMIVVMGFIVGGVAISLLLPIFTVSKIMAH